MNNSASELDAKPQSSKVEEVSAVISLRRFTVADRSTM